MALSSSPPLLPEAGSPTLPLLFPEELSELPPRSAELPVAESSRKRHFSDYENLSSDPLFSEGTSDAEEESNEVDLRRRKRLVKGPWYRLRRASTQSLRRSMATRERRRVADSGVWMGSDLSDDSIDSTLSSRRKMARLDMDEPSPASTPPPTQTPRLPTAEELAGRTIDHCLETGREAVDISDLGLANLSNAVLKPLHQLIRHAHADLTQPPSEDEFSPLTPSIQLFVSGNKLSSLPGELFRLTNIAVLSLRYNNLYEIPPAIGRLQNLKELNIAQNGIKWLPWEMLNLLHCRGEHRRVTIRPNPLISPMAEFAGPSPLPRPAVTATEFREHLSRWGETSGAFFQQMKQWYQEDGVPWTMRHEMELRLKLGRLRLNKYVSEASRAGVELQLCKEQLIYVASSAVQYFDVDGSFCRSNTATMAGPDEERFAAVVDPLENVPPSSPTFSMPSLFELALRTTQANFYPSELYGLAEELPENVTAALRRAFRAAEYGNESCSVCGSRFIIARAEWMEYWFNGFPAQDFLTPEFVIPFLRKACSWTCAQPSELGAFRL